MGRQVWKPGNMLYPLPAVMVSVADRQGNANLFTVAWTGTLSAERIMGWMPGGRGGVSSQILEKRGEAVLRLSP